MGDELLGSRECEQQQALLVSFRRRRGKRRTRIRRIQPCLLFIRHGVLLSESTDEEGIPWPAKVLTARAGGSRGARPPYKAQRASSPSMAWGTPFTVCMDESPGMASNQVSGGGNTSPWARERRSQASSILVTGARGAPRAHRSSRARPRSEARGV